MQVKTPLYYGSVKHVGSNCVPILHLAALTCYRKACCAAGNGSQVVNCSNTLVGALVWLVVFRVDHVCEEQRAIREDVPPLIGNQAHESAVFFPFDACRRGCVTMC